MILRSGDRSVLRCNGISMYGVSPRAPSRNLTLSDRTDSGSPNNRRRVARVWMLIPDQHLGAPCLPVLETWEISQAGRASSRIAVTLLAMEGREGWDGVVLSQVSKARPGAPIFFRSTPG
jgi:hypothetical protein